jgi:hypothetical protein
VSLNILSPYTLSQVDTAIFSAANESIGEPNTISLVLGISVFFNPHCVDEKIKMNAIVLYI